MKVAKVTAVVFLVAFLTPVFADWTKSADLQNVSFYFDAHSIQHSEGIVSVLELYDHKSPQRLPDNTTYSSQKLFKEYDCETSMHRVSSLTTYEGKMLTGAFTQTGEAQQWSPVKPKTYSDRVLKALCRPVSLSNA